MTSHVGLRWWTMSLFIGAMGLLQGTAGRAEECQNKVVIEVGTMGAQDAAGWLLDRIEEFKRAYPNVTVNTQKIEQPSRLTEPLFCANELALNVLGVTSEWMGLETAYLVERDLIVPLGHFLPDPEFNLDDFGPQQWDSVTYRGEKWGVPYLCSPVLLVADWELFQEAGIADPPHTWTEFVDCSKKLTKDRDGDGQIDQWGFRLGKRGDGNYMVWLLMTIAMQKGVQIFNGREYDLDSREMMEAYEFIQSLTEEAGAHHDDRKFREVARDDSVRYAMQMAPIYYLDATRGKKQYRVIPWPTDKQGVTADERTQYLVIGRSTPEQEAASWEFVKWVSRPDVPLPGKISLFHIGCRKGREEREDFRLRVASYCEGFGVAEEAKTRCRMALPLFQGHHASLLALWGTFSQTISGNKDLLSKAEESMNTILYRVSDYRLYR